MPQATQKPASGLAHARIHAILASTDVTRSRDFYVNTLGLKQTEFTEGHEVRLEGADGTTIYIYQRPGAKPSEATVAGFVVDDLDEAVNNLRSRGVRFEEYDLPDIKTEQGIAKVGHDRAAWFKDPDGHILALGEA